MISISNITKKFGDFTAVDNLSMSVKSGEVLGFLGPNGAGKSTTMKMITGFMKPTEGIIKVKGMNVETNPIECKKLIGYLPEGAPLYGDMTPINMLKFVAYIRGMDLQEFKTALDIVVIKTEITDVINQPIDTLSKGYKRRVGLAQALIHDPEILILDEPTDGLDPNQKHHVRNLINEIGIEKLIWGSDMPACERTLSYKQSLVLYKEKCEFLTKEQRDLITGGNLEKLYPL